MARVRCKFLGARPLKDGSLTGMIVFENITTADRHALIDLEGDVFLTNEYSQPLDAEIEQALNCKNIVSRIVDVLVNAGIEINSAVKQSVSQITLSESSGDL